MNQKENQEKKCFPECNCTDNGRCKFKCKNSLFSCCHNGYSPCHQLKPVDPTNRLILEKFIEGTQTKYFKPQPVDPTKKQCFKCINFGMPCGGNDCACHENHISDKVIHTKEKCYLKQLETDDRQYESWEIEFDEKFDIQLGESQDKIKSFISNLLQEEREKVFQEIKDVKVSVSNMYDGVPLEDILQTERKKLLEEIRDKMPNEITKKYHPDSLAGIQKEAHNNLLEKLTTLLEKLGKEE